MKTDKKNSNLLIAGGYCLVAVVILFNYLGAAVNKERGASERAPQNVDIKSSVQPGNLDALTRQLDEEKRVNLEMREMLRMMQSAIGENSGGGAAAISYAAPDSGDLFEIPEIRFNLAEDILRVRSNPFIPGKNPFAPTTKSEDLQRAPLLDSSIAKALRGDSRLPFFISGANSKSGYFANF